MSNTAEPTPQNRKQSRDEGRAIGAFYAAGHRGRVSRRIGKRLEKFGAALPPKPIAFNARRAAA